MAAALAKVVKNRTAISKIKEKLFMFILKKFVYKKCEKKKFNCNCKDFDLLLLLYYYFFLGLFIIYFEILTFEGKGRRAFLYLNLPTSAS